MPPDIIYELNTEPIYFNRPSVLVTPTCLDFELS